MNLFNITYNGVSLNEVSVYKPNALEGIDGLEIRKSFDQITGADGGVMWNSYYDARILHIEASLTANDAAEYHALKESLIRAFSRTPEALPLSIVRWGDGVEKIAYAKVYNMPRFREVGGQLDFNSFAVDLLIEDGYFYDSEEQVIFIKPGSEGGTPVPTPVPFPVGGGYDIAEVDNTGGEIGYAEYRIYGRIINPLVRNATTGRQFGLSTTIEGGDYVDVGRDIKGEYVITSSSQNYYRFLYGTIFPIEAGVINAITFGGSSFDESATLEIRFRKRGMLL